jgi:peptidoglycan hydrolase-like protein with peptidoglycan-binding domain
MPTKKTIRNRVCILTIAGAIILSPTFVQAELGDTVLVMGVENEDVKTLQQYLIDLGYLELEETTTYFGEKTHNALIEFQKDYGLDADGSFGPETYKALLEVVSKYEPLTYSRPLKKEMRGEDVRQLQERLKVLGFLVIDECTDYFGSMTKEAVINFQREYGLKVDGIAGPETIRAINLALKDVTDSSLLMQSSRSGSFVNSIGESIAKTAREYLGCKYRYGGSGPSSFDCSGFTKFIYEKFGINLPRSSSEQASIGTKVSRDELQVGDLLIFSNTYRTGPSHTGIYLGNNKFIHASTSTKGVIISDLNSDYYRKHFSYGRRVF